MATYTGTNNSDTFTGTSSADTFNFTVNVLGGDVIDGGGGSDTLNLSYASLAGGTTSYIGSAGGSFFSNGLLYGDYNGDYLSFSNIEKLNVTLGQGDDTLVVDGAALATAGTSLTLKGGAGTNTLGIDFSALSASTFSVASNGTITSNRGTFAQWQVLDITLGAGTNSVTTQGGNDRVVGGSGNDTINTGAGSDTLYGNGGTNTLNSGNDDDYIYSTGGTDTVNGGVGYDAWYGDYSATATARTFSWNGVTGSGTLTGGTTLAGIETVQFKSGAGADTFTLTGGVQFNAIDAGDGIDTATISYAGTTTGHVAYSYLNYDADQNGFTGVIYGNGDSAYLSGTSVTDIEKLTVTLDDSDNYISVDDLPFANGATLSLNGGNGSDRLELYLYLADANRSTTFTTAANGSVTHNITGLTLNNFEAYSLHLADGTNNITTGALADSVFGGAGNDTINTGDGADVLYANGGTNVLNAGAGTDLLYSVGGADSINGGTDSDTWNGDYSSIVTNQTFTYNALTSTGSLTGGTTLSGIETANLTTGSGNDSFSLTGIVNGNFNGGDGTDTLTLNQAGLTGFYYYSNAIYANNTGGFDGYTDGNNYLFNFENLNLTYGDDDTYVSVDAAPLASGATLNLNGGVGNDRLVLDLSTGGSTTFTVAANGALTENIANASFTNFESYDLTLGNGTNNVTTGAYDDIIRGGMGNDTLNGGIGTDSLYDAGGTNTLNGNDGNDDLHATAGTNALNGGNDDDQIYSVGGKDTVNGGTGNDHWYGDYSASAANLTFSFNGTTGAGSLTGGTTIVGIETADLSTGTGNDALSVSGVAYTRLSGGLGFDTLTLNQAGITGIYYNSYIYSNGTGGFSGYTNGGGNYLYDIEALNVTYSNDDNYVQVDATPLALGAMLNLNGGVGSDTLDVNFQGGGGVAFATAANGTSTVTNGTFASFEALRVTGSEEADTITGGTGNDILDGRGGADSINGGAGDDTLYSHYSPIFGAGDDDGTDVDTLNGGTGNDLIAGGFGDNLDGGADSDTVSIEAVTYGAAITLNFDGIFTSAGMTLNGGTVKNFERYGYLTGGTQDDVLTVGDAVEDVSANYHGLYGYEGNDTITAGAGDNRIYGGAGDDLIAPGAGDDYVDGGGNTDTVTYASANGGVTVEADYTYYNGYTYVTGAAGTDVLVGVENYIGSAFNDIFTDGYDSGDNVFIGGTGIDSLYYRSARSSVTVNLSLTGPQSTGGGGLDTISGIENLGGGIYDDSLIGDSGDNEFSGGLGNDTLNGAGGSDTASYDGYGAVTVSLAISGQQDTGSDGLDTLISIENLTGSAYDDALTGNSGANVLTGGQGNDTINGGSGTDIAVYSGAWTDYDVNSAGGTVTVYDKRGIDGTDTVTNVEKFAFANGTFTAAQIVNVAPVAANDSAGGVIEAGSGTAGQANASGNALTNDSDANLQTAGLGEMLAVTAIYATDGQGNVIGGAGVSGATQIAGIFGTLTINPNGGFSYHLDDADPDADALSQGQSASDVFRYTVTDAHGLTSDALITIGITGSADGGAPTPPTAGSDSLYVTRTVASSLDASVLLANDSGASGETLSVTGVSNATGGTVSLVNGKLVVNASAAIGGFDYTVSGSNGGAATGHVNFTSVATSSSANTVTAPASATAADLQGLGGADKLTGGTGNDHLVGGASTDTLAGGAGIDTADYSGAWVNYSVSVASGTTTITDLRSGTPDGADKVSAVELFKFSNGTFAAAEIVNVGPTASDDDSTVNEAGTGDPGSPDAYGNVLGNDSDPNLNTAGLGETLAVSGVRTGTLAAGGTLTNVSGATAVTGSYGTLTINADGSYHYALDNANPAVEALAPGQAATDTFTYAIKDAHGVASSAQLIVTVNGADDQVLAVTARPDSLLVTTALAASLNASVLTANDAAPNGQTFSLTGISNVTGGTATLASGKLAITLTGATGGFDYTITGSGGGTSTAHVTLTGVATTSGNNTVTAGANYAAADLQGQAGNDLLTGTAGDDRLLGGAGNDALTGGAGNDLLDGGAGNDIYVVDGTETIAEAAGTAGGTDTIQTALSSYSLGVNLENLTFTGSGGFAGYGNTLANVITGGALADTLVGGDGNDTLNGGGGDDVLDGGIGNDKLDGGTGADQMTGGAGSDSYVVDNIGDVITEAAGTAGGVDTVTTSLASYTLADVLENLTGTLSTGFSGTGNNFANIIIGGAGADTLTGLDGNDTLSGGVGNDVLDGGVGNDKLDGGAGADQMTGGAGNDSYVVDNAGDTIVEAAGTAGGVDSVTTSLASYTLADVLENLTGTRSAGFVGTGNTSANVITGAAGADALSGLDGNDTLSGGAGNDTLDGGVGNDALDGGSGADQMTGGTGNDSYVVDNASDVIVEAADSSGGVDSATTSLASYVMVVGLENLTATIKTGFTGTGNALANTMTGGAGNDALTGLAGNDVLNGGTGNDVINGGDDADKLTGSTGSDTMAGGSGGDTFYFLKTTDFGPVGALDRITDFSTAEGDKIDLATIDPSSASGNQAFTFIGTAAFTTASHTTFELRYQDAGSGDLLVQLDTTRDGVADYSFLVHATSLAATDFFL